MSAEPEVTRAYRFAVEATSEQTDVVIPISGVASGDYRVRVLVDGVPSDWTRDAIGEILQRVTIP